MTSFDWDRFVAVADRVAPLFDERTTGITKLVESSILFSDGLCFCALCELFGVDSIVEGGTGYGGSTEMFARYYPEGASVRGIWTIDEAVNPRWQRPLAVLGLKHYSRHVWSTRKRAKQVSRQRLASYSHVTLVRGDAIAKLPRQVAQLVQQGRRVGVLLDGPKAEEQMRLAEAVLAMSPSVMFVAVDDIGPPFDHERREARFRASPHATFATSDRAFFDRYRWINRDRVPRRMLENPEHTGDGMGILVNSAQPRC